MAESTEKTEKTAKTEKKGKTEKAGKAEKAEKPAADKGEFGIEEMATFCKRKGFVFPSSEIYGGMAGFWDYGPYGAELKRNMMSQWWKYHVQSRQDIVGIDGAIISNPKVWVASGHVGGFGDVMIECKKCNERVRADNLIEDAKKIQCDGLSAEDLGKLIQENEIKCPKCGAFQWHDPKVFNLLFKTNVGAVEGEKAVAYLRGETAQIIFAEFKNVFEVSRLKLPFGIAQMGKAFRNEIAPRNFLFRCREFEQMEIEYFIHPEKKDECPFFDEIKDEKILVYSAEMQEKGNEAKMMTAKEALDSKIIKSPWHAYWLATELRWFKRLGAKMENFRIRQHGKDELAFYSSDCWDLEYKFPFGWKELQGIADRSDYDLQQHTKHSGKDHMIHDEATGKKVMPNVVAEPSLGVDRSFLVFMFDSYNDDKERGNIVLHLHPKLAPIKVAVLPLVNKLNEKAQEIYTMLKDDMFCFYDKSGSVGRRYARMDELGTPYCVTVDFDSLEKDDVTIRNRDTTEQVRVKIPDLKDVLRKLLNTEMTFDQLKK
ncbi:TPA: glycine--tRNA ligase [Candidatus Woesearchaeota archaeon]|nr:glycine--tRNA ligase [Candidatus Woesearchaeota archaeon]